MVCAPLGRGGLLAGLVAYPSDADLTGPLLAGLGSPTSTRRHPSPVSNAPADDSGGLPRSRGIQQHVPISMAGPRPGRRRQVRAPDHVRPRLSARPRRELSAVARHLPAVRAATRPGGGRPCHWTATLVRVLDRAGGAGVWLVLTGGARPASVRKRVARRRPRDCRRRSGRCLRCRRRWISGWSCGCWRSGAGCGCTWAGRATRHRGRAMPRIAAASRTPAEKPSAAP